MSRSVLVVVALFSLSACQLFQSAAPPQTDVDESVIARAPTDQSSWISDRGSYQEQRYSASGLINEHNLDSLQLQWTLNLDGHSNQTPLAIDNTIYLVVPGRSVMAVDAASGSTLWKVNASGQRSLTAGAQQPSNGGMAIWGGNLYVTSSAGRLLAFDRGRGKLLWQSEVVQHDSQFFTSAPRLIGGSVVVSVGGRGEGGGYLAAYDADSGTEVWRYQAETAEAEHAQESLQFLAYDSELQMLYLAVWTPVEDGEVRYFSCPRLVAIQAQNGEYLWELPAAASPVRICNQHATALVDLVVEGRMRSLLIQSLGTSGLNLVDRVTGQVVAVDSQTVVGMPRRDAKDESEQVELVTVDSCEGSERVQLPLSSAMAVDPINKLIFLGLERSAENRCQDGMGYLLAWDPLAREVRWQVSRPDLTAGLLATGGNVLFQAAQSKLLAYHSSSGEKRWSYPLEAASAPITYQIDGRQYLAVVAAASEGKARPQLMVFAVAEDELEAEAELAEIQEEP